MFAQVYETLVRVDCEDRLVAGLAERWTSDSASGLWTLTLRSDATFSDGSPVTTDDVVASWRERRSSPRAYRDPAGPAVDLITVEGPRRISVHIRGPHTDGPRVLADPAFAVHRTSSDADTRLGTGVYAAPRVPDAAPLTSPGAPVTLTPRTPGSVPVVVVRSTPSADARDAIDAGADLLVTADRRVTEYVALRPELRTNPLPADRAYVLLATLRASAAAGRDTVDHAGWSALRSSLMRDVIRTPPTVRGDDWWGARDATDVCTDAGTIPAPTRASIPAPTRPRRLIHAASDRVAGEIAQRLVALATYEARSGEIALSALMPEWFERTDIPLTAMGVSDGDLELALAQGRELGFLVSLPRRSLDPCRTWRGLVAAVPWIRPGLLILSAESGPVLVRSADAPALVVDWANTLRIVPSLPVASVGR